MMKNLIITSFIQLCFICTYAQEFDTNYLKMKGRFDSVEMHFGDTIIQASYEYMGYKHLQEGIKKGNEQNFKGAVTEFDEAQSFDPTNKEIYFNRGLAYYFLSINNVAISDYSRAIEIDTNYFLAYLQRGVAYYKALNYEKAILDFRKAIEIEPSVSGGHLNLGSAFLNSNKRDEACESFRKAKELGNKTADVLILEYCN